MKRTFQKLTALALAGVIAATPVLAAGSVGDGRTPTVDEAYYGMMDYYGNLTEGSVVKSYVLNGATSITDYGSYESLNNLTNGTAPTVAGDKITFDFGSNAPSHFYLEGVTAQPFSLLPWRLTVRYSLNGVPAKAEDLAGAKGVVEINIDAIPNALAGEYERHNYTLETMAIFNQDKILSFEAPGAQVQLLGNLRAALFLCFPGEEGHFTLRVGTDDFQFGGMTFLMVPATLSQLEEIAKLSEKKGQLEENYEKLSNSLDELLDSLDAVSASLNNAAAGLDTLDAARATVAAGKGNVYSKADAVLSDLDTIHEALGPVSGDLETAKAALTDSKEVLGNFTGDMTSLRTELAELKALLAQLEENGRALTEGMEDVVDDAQADAKALADKVRKLQENKKALAALIDDLSGMETELDAMYKALWSERKTRIDPVWMSGVDTSSLNTLVKQEQSLESAFTAVSADGKTVALPGFIAAANSVANAQKSAAEQKSSTEVLANSIAAYAALTATGLEALTTTAAGTATAFGITDTETVAGIGQTAGALFVAKTVVTQMATSTNKTPAQIAADETLSAQAVQSIAEALAKTQVNAAASAQTGTEIDAWASMTDEAKVSYINAAFSSAADAFKGYLGALAVQAAFNTADGAYEDTADKKLTYQEFLYAILQLSDEYKNTAKDSADGLFTIYTMDKQGTLDLISNQVKSINSSLSGTLSGVNQSIATVNNLMSKLITPTAELMQALAEVTGDAGELNAMLDDADALLTALADLADIDIETDDLDAMKGTVKSLSDLGQRSIDKIMPLLDDVDTLYGLVDTYEPEAQNALDTASTLLDAATQTLTDTSEFSRALERLMKTSGSQLDAGTSQSLKGISGSLRSVADSLDATEGLRDAKQSISGIIEDTWKDYTGDVMDILEMDATAPAVSLTDSRNPSPKSVQILLRTQEIKSSEENSSAAQDGSQTSEEETGSTGLWGRIKAMFSGIGHSIAGFFTGIGRTVTAAIHSEGV